jgi:transcriptional regulator with XRE-family HTH domain
MAESKSEASHILGARLRSRRLELSLNQEDVAHRAGLNVSNYARVERGYGNPTFYTLVRLALVLVMEPGQLLSGLTSEHLPPTRDSVDAPTQAGLTP